MDQANEIFIAFAANWFPIIARASLHGAAAILLILGLETLFVSIPPTVRCWLWRLAFAKILMVSIC